jgi:hypothetical protein
VDASAPTGNTSVLVEGDDDDDTLSSRTIEDAAKTVQIESDLLQRDDTKKLWVDVLSGNRNPANGLAMEYVAPKLVNGEVEVEIENSDIESEVKFWESSLIMYVLGSELSMSAVKQFMIKT